MIRTFKVLSLLMSYPTEAIQEAAPEFRGVVESEALVPVRVRGPLFALIDELAERDLYDLQERYVLLFDRTRSLSLHLFEHVHGESRDRGQAMVDLMALYESHGLVIGAKELPDYLPLFLEFLATCRMLEARSLLAQPLHVVAALRERLQKRKSVYTAAFRALEVLADGKAEAEPLAALLSEPEDDPNDLEALDRVWEEEVVTFGPANSAAGMVAPGGSCPATRATLARMDQPRAQTNAEKGTSHG
jgi:nitrate reductase molybdenum cofactor assembly chaperone NarJ/NarW